MRNRDDGGKDEGTWGSELPLGIHDAARTRWFGRLARDLQGVVRNEVETRRFLAEEVYGIPEAWLDDVIRLRLAEPDLDAQ